MNGTHQCFHLRLTEGSPHGGAAAATRKPSSPRRSVTTAEITYDNLYDVTVLRGERRGGEFCNMLEDRRGGNMRDSRRKKQ